MAENPDINAVDNILEITALKKYFPVGKNTLVKAVDGVDLTLKRGETLGLVGESGSGKSTIAYMVVGMFQPTEGEIRFNAAPLQRKRDLRQKGDIQIVFQDPGGSFNPRRTIEQSFRLALKKHAQLQGEQAAAKTGELLELVGLPAEFQHKNPLSLGGGERQLVSIARALATNPALMVLDEPTSALDVSMQAKVIGKLMELQQKMNLSYLFITHDLSLMRNVASRVAIMYLGKLCELADTTEFFTNPLHPYTRMLLSSIPVATDAEEAYKPHKIIPEGEIPSPVNLPPGCSFHLRCPEKTPICAVKRPHMCDCGNGHSIACHKYNNKETP